MTLYYNDAGTGSDTTAVSIGNSGGGGNVAFGSVSPGTSGAITYSADHAIHGSPLSFKFAPDTTTACSCAWTGLSASQGAVSFYLWLTGNPSASLDLFRFGNVTTMFIGLTTASKMFLDTSGGGVIWTATNALALNAWNRIEAQMSISSTAALTAGQYFAGANLESPTATESFTASNGNTGTSNFTQGQIGKVNASLTMPTFYIAGLRFTDSSSSPLGPYPLPPTPPVSGASGASFRASNF